MAKAESFASTIAIARVEIDAGTGQRQKTTVALTFFIQSSKDNNRAVWVSAFDDVISLILDVLHDPDPDIRDLSLRLMRDLLKNQTDLFDTSISRVVAELLKCHEEKDRLVLRTAEDTLAMLSSVIMPTTCVRILEPILLGDDVEVSRLLAAIKLLTKTLKNMTLEEMESVQDYCIPGIVKGYTHPQAEVRKGVVFALVEMYIVIQEPLMQKLGALSTSQKKLLMIYIKRAQDKATTTGVA